MSLPTKFVLGILIDNLLKRKSVIKLSPRVTTSWARGLNIPRGGKTVIYTGHMYQLIPSISALAGKMAYFENSWITKFFGLGWFVNKFINIAWFMARTDSKVTERYNNILRNIARLLQAVNSFQPDERDQLLGLLERFLLTALSDVRVVEECCRRCGTEHDGACVVNKAHSALVGRPIEHP